MIGGAIQQAWLSRKNLTIFCNKIHERGAPLTNRWGFVDGTVCQIYIPGRNQLFVYNRQKKGKRYMEFNYFQSVAEPNRLIANSFGPAEGWRHVGAMLAKSGLLQMLERYSIA